MTARDFRECRAQRHRVIAISSGNGKCAMWMKQQGIRKQEEEEEAQEGVSGDGGTTVDYTKQMVLHQYFNVRCCASYRSCLRERKIVTPFEREISSAVLPSVARPRRG